MRHTRKILAVLWLVAVGCGGGGTTPDPQSSTVPRPAPKAPAGGMSVGGPLHAETWTCDAYDPFFYGYRGPLWGWVSYAEYPDYTCSTACNTTQGAADADCGGMGACGESWDLYPNWYGGCGCYNWYHCSIEY